MCVILLQGRRLVRLRSAFYPGLPKLLIGLPLRAQLSCQDIPQELLGSLVNALPPQLDCRLRTLGLAHIAPVSIARIARIAHTACAACSLRRLLLRSRRSLQRSILCNEGFQSVWDRMGGRRRRRRQLRSKGRLPLGGRLNAAPAASCLAGSRSPARRAFMARVALQRGAFLRTHTWPKGGNPSVLPIEKEFVDSAPVLLQDVAATADD